MPTPLISLIPVLAVLPVRSPHPFATSQNIGETVRLALTPILNGSIQPEEWESFVDSPEVQSRFQWEPGKLHVSGTLPTSKEFVVSIDGKANGWLIGKDNVELRARLVDGKVQMTANLLDASNTNGPYWIPVPELALATRAVAETSGGNWTVEMTMEDPALGIFPVDGKRKLGVRLDAVDFGEARDAFLPRVMNNTVLDFQRGSNMPGGLKWGVDIGQRTVTPGEQMLARLTFNGSDKLNLKRFEVRSEGVAADTTQQLSGPFPNFDVRGRAFFDYQTPIAGNDSGGYRLLAAKLIDASNLTGVVRASYQVEPEFQFSLVRPDQIRVQPDKPQRMKLSLYFHSRERKLQKGMFEFKLPEGWRVVRQVDLGFTLIGRTNAVRRVLQIEVPAGASGAFPIDLTATIGERSHSQREWVRIGKL